VGGYLLASKYLRKLYLFVWPNAIRQRFEYAQRHVEDLFTNVIFTDEAVFQLSENQTLHWRNSDSEGRPVFEDNHKKNKVMI